jgi:hypothetical protein
MHVKRKAALPGANDELLQLTLVNGTYRVRDDTDGGARVTQLVQLCPILVDTTGAESRRLNRIQRLSSAAAEFVVCLQQHDANAGAVCGVEHDAVERVGGRRGAGGGGVGGVGCVVKIMELADCGDATRKHFFEAKLTRSTELSGAKPLGKPVCANV